MHGCPCASKNRFISSRTISTVEQTASRSRKSVSMCIMDLFRCTVLGPPQSNGELGDGWGDGCRGRSLLTHADPEPRPRCCCLVLPAATLSIASRPCSFCAISCCYLLFCYLLSFITQSLAIGFCPKQQPFLPDIFRVDVSVAELSVKGDFFGQWQCHADGFVSRLQDFLLGKWRTFPLLQNQEKTAKGEHGYDHQRFGFGLV